MKPITNIDEYWEHTKKRLPDIISAATAKHDDIPPLIVPAKDGKILAYVNPAQAGDRYLLALKVIILGMEPDEVIFLTDAYTSSAPTKHDGTPWQHGEMEKAFLDMTVDHDLVEENVNMLRVDRMGNVRSYSQDYTRNEDDTVTLGKIRDIDEYRQFTNKAQISGNAEGVGGFVVEKLREFFSIETFREHLRKVAPDDPMLKVSDEDFAIMSTVMVTKGALLPLKCEVLLTVEKDGPDNFENEYLEQDEVGGFRLTSKENLNEWNIFKDD